MLSGNCQAGPSTTSNMEPSDNYQTIYDSKTKMVVFYFLISKCLVCVVIMSVVVKAQKRNPVDMVIISYGAFIY